MALIFKNNASSTLASDITNVATTLTVSAGDGAKFPSTAGGNTFMVTVEDSVGNCEIMLCTGRTADVLTVTRAQESTVARAFSSGAVVENRFTAGTMSSYALSANVQPIDATLTALAGVTVAADKIIYATGADAFSTTDLTSTARTLLDDTSTTAMRTTLGVAIGTDVQAYDSTLMKSGTVTARTRAHSFTPAAVTAASGGALAIDCDLHEECTITLSETTTTVGSASNQVAGKYVVIIITGATGKALAWNTNWKKDGAACTIAAPANGVKDMHCFRSDGTNMIHIGSKLAV